MPQKPCHLLSPETEKSNIATTVLIQYKDDFLPV